MGITLSEANRRIREIRAKVTGPLYVIEARDENGQLKFGCPQPESVFGISAITGIDDDMMAKVIFRQVPDTSLRGDSIALWPRLLNPNWTARRKTW